MLSLDFAFICLQLGEEESGPTATSSASLAVLVATVCKMI